MYKIEFLGEVGDFNKNLDNLRSLPAPNGAINEQVHLSSVAANVKLTADGHFQDTR